MMIYWLCYSELTYDEKLSMIFSNPEYFNVENLVGDIVVFIVAQTIMEILQNANKIR